MLCISVSLHAMYGPIPDSEVVHDTPVTDYLDTRHLPPVFVSSCEACDGDCNHFTKNMLSVGCSGSGDKEHIANAKVPHLV
jgi:hypothetical protein